MSDQDWEKARARIESSYNTPPEVPREAMWEAIAGQLGSEEADSADQQADVVPLRRAAPARPAWQWGTFAAMAAGITLWIGFGLGRATTAGPTAEIGVAEESPAEVLDVPVQNPAASRAAGVVRMAASRHLAATQTLLAQVGSGVEAGSLDPNVATWANQLLTDTRLMLDSPVGQQGDLRSLLEDLELILVQVVHASRAGTDGNTGEVELQQLTQGLQDNDVLPRIQELLPPVMAGAAD